MRIPSFIKAKCLQQIKRLLLLAQQEFLRLVLLAAQYKLSSISKTLKLITVQQERDILQNPLTSLITSLD